MENRNRSHQANCPVLGLIMFVRGKKIKRLEKQILLKNMAGRFRLLFLIPASMSAIHASMDAERS